jgi:myo-inositol-1(or 4)-monophosphatase
LTARAAHAPGAAREHPGTLARTAEAIAREAGALVRSRLATPGRIGTKSGAIDLVTDTDRDADAIITRRIREAFPGHTILSEESGSSVGARGRAEQGGGETSDIQWVVDPLDGTMNFAHGFPHFAVSIAAVRLESNPGGKTATVPDEMRGRMLAGVVYDPMRDELFRAADGEPATLNGAPISVSSAANVASCLLATGFPYDRREHPDFYLSFWRELMLRSQDVRRAGAAALDLAWVACGRLDAFWEWSLHPWDIAAGVLIVRRAGGRATDFAGSDLFLGARQTLASNGRVHDELLGVLQPLARRQTENDHG